MPIPHLTATESQMKQAFQDAFELEGHLGFYDESDTDLYFERFIEKLRPIVAKSKELKTNSETPQ